MKEIQRVTLEYEHRAHCQLQKSLFEHVTPTAHVFLLPTRFYRTLPLQTEFHHNGDRRELRIVQAIHLKNIRNFLFFIHSNATLCAFHTEISNLQFSKKRSQPTLSKYIHSHYTG